jgi:single-strand DNA-binding protein
MVNRVELLGNLTRDPELHYTPLGAPYCFLRIATNRFSGNERHTDFHFVTAWHGNAQRAAERLRRGDRVFIEGRIETYALTRDGVRQERMRLVATRLVFLHDRPPTRPINDQSGVEHIREVIEHEAPVMELREPAEDAA